MGLLGWLEFENLSFCLFQVRAPMRGLQLPCIYEDHWLPTTPLQHLYTKHISLSSDSNNLMNKLAFPSTSQHSHTAPVGAIQRSCITLCISTHPMHPMHPSLFVPSHPCIPGSKSRVSGFGVTFVLTLATHLDRFGSQNNVRHPIPTLP
jgi:hypothetical protein